MGVMYCGCCDWYVDEAEFDFTRNLCEYHVDMADAPAVAAAETEALKSAGRASEPHQVSEPQQGPPNPDNAAAHKSYRDGQS